jgi:hypothetical protein
MWTPTDRFSPPHHVGEAIERVAYDAVNPLDTGSLERFDKKFSGCPAHTILRMHSSRFDWNSPRDSRIFASKNYSV